MSACRPTFDSSRRVPSCAFTLVELLVVIAIIGVLVALLLPAVQAAREAARRTQCTNNLRQIGLAMANYASEREKLPVGCEGCGQFPVGKRTSWLLRLLPYLEQQSLADLYDDSLPAKHATNREVAIVVEDFLCPSEPSDVLFSETKTWKGCAFTDYGGVFGVEGTDSGSGTAIDEENLGVLLYNDPVQLTEITDGTTKTLAVAELLNRRISECVWTNGENVFAQEETTPINANSGFGGDLGSPHPGGALGVFCDGRADWLADSTDQRVLIAMLTKAGDEVSP